MNKGKLGLNMLHVVGHLTGVAVVLSVQALFFVDHNVFDAVAEGVKHASFYKLVTVPTLIQVGLSACFWALLFIAYQWLKLTIREHKQPKKVLLKSRGTILTETLIVFPVFLLLTSGLSQLSINMSASILTAVGTFQASRTAWLWEPETRGSNPRNGMDGNTEEVAERARIAAASVITPVVPAEFRGTCNFSDLFDQRMRTITKTGAYAGAAGAAAVQGIVAGTNKTGNPEQYFFNRAFDTSPFATRGAKKLYLAYCLTEATYSVQGEDVVTNVEYTHANVFPWFAYVFGQPTVAAGNPGYYSVFKNQNRIRAQVDVNPREPRSLASTLDGLIDGLLGGI